MMVPSLKRILTRTWKLTGFANRTLWDGLQLLLVPIVIPLAIFFGTNYFNALQNQTSMQIAADQQQEATLQTYLDHMSDLLLNDKLSESKVTANVREIARIETLTVLPRLNPNRKATVLQFLYESGLIYANKQVVDLHQANLSGITLVNTGTLGGNPASSIVSETITPGAYLPNIELNGTVLNNANFFGAILMDADLLSATLDNADLSRAKLKGANLNEADLSQADLSQADLSQASLKGANLSGANLSGATVTNAQLAQAKSLHGTIMPDGLTHP